MIPPHGPSERGGYFSRSSFSAIASRMNLETPYVPTRALMSASVSAGKRSGSGFPIGGRPIGRAVAGCVAAGKKTIPFSVDAINDADYINAIVFGGKLVSHSISARRPDGTFNVEVHDWNGGLAHAGNYPDRASAQSAAEHWERLVTLSGGQLGPVLTIDEILSDSELFGELSA